MRDWRPITGIDLHSRTSARVGRDHDGDDDRDDGGHDGDDYDSDVKGQSILRWC